MIKRDALQNEVLSGDAGVLQVAHPRGIASRQNHRLYLQREVDLFRAGRLLQAEQQKDEDALPSQNNPGKGRGAKKTHALFISLIQCVRIYFNTMAGPNDHPFLSNFFIHHTATPLHKTRASSSARSQIF
jgi:hypothetical protein